MPKPLTSRFLETVKSTASRQEIPDAGLVGLYLIVQPSGVKSWAVRYRYNRKPRKLTIGTYPRLSLKQAREEAASALRAVDEGHDPAQEKKDDKAERSSGRFLSGAVLDEYLSRHVRQNNRSKTAKEAERLINHDIRPYWSETDIRDIRRKDILDVLDRVTDRGARYTANQLYAVLSRFFRFCLERGFIEDNPFSHIPKPKKPVSRDRVLNEEEIRAFWKVCEQLGWPFGPIGQLLLLTGQRRGEVGAMRWNEIDFDEETWTIPASRAKNGVEHLVHLSGSAIEILSSLPRTANTELLFTTTGATPVSGYSRAKRSLDAGMLEQLGRELVPWRFHDLRRTAASGMAALNIAPHVVEKVLNHRTGTIQGVAAIYNRYEYSEQRQRALEAWSARVKEIVGNRPMDNVVSIRQ